MPPLSIYKVWILKEPTSFRYSHLEDKLRWWFLCKWLIEGLHWRKEWKQHRVEEEAKQVCGLTGVLVIYCCIFPPKLVVENNFIISWFWWVRNLDRVQWDEVAQRTEGDWDNATGDISLGSSFLPHVESIGIEISKIACSPTCLTLGWDVWNTWSRSASALSPSRFSPHGLCSSHHSPPRIIRHF